VGARSGGIEELRASRARIARSARSRVALLPHCDIDPDCCGCLDQVIDEAGTKFICNECGAIVSREDAAPILMETESCEATCPHWGCVNEITGFGVFCFRVPVLR
jgi:hypothetical protein